VAPGFRERGSRNFIDVRKITPGTEGRWSTAATGMARPRWSARSSRSWTSTSAPRTGSPTATSPTTSPTRCCPRTARSSSKKVKHEGGRPSASRGTADADRCFFIDDTGRFIDGDFMTALLAESLLAKSPGRDDPLRRPGPGRAGRRHGREGGRHSGDQTVSATRFFKGRMRREGSMFGGEVSGHYYFPRLLLRRDRRHDPRPADARAALRGAASSSASSWTPTAPRTSSPARSTPRWTTPPPRSPKIEEKYGTTSPPAHDHPRRRRLRRLRRLALQRALVRTPSRCCACAWSPLVVRGRTWSAGGDEVLALIRS